MAAASQFQYDFTVQPPTPTGTATTQRFKVTGAVNITGSTNAIAEIHLIPDDFVAGSSSEPEVAMDLEYGSPYIDINVTLGGGTENCASEVITAVDGIDPDLTEIRGLVLRAFPQNSANPSKVQALLTCGDLSAPDMATLAIPVAFDSAGSGFTADEESAAVLAIPTGIAFDSAHLMNLKIYEALNVRLVLLLQGK